MISVEGPELLSNSCAIVAQGTKQMALEGRRGATLHSSSGSCNTHQQNMGWEKLLLEPSHNSPSRWKWQPHGHYFWSCGPQTSFYWFTNARCPQKPVSNIEGGK